MSDLLLGIDIGTSGSKGVVARPDGSVVATAERPHATSRPRPGWFEHDAQHIWWADFVALSRELAAATKAQGQIAAVCVSGIGATLLPADENGAPLRPAILYGVDTRSEREIAELTDHFGAEAILERCGTALTSQAVGPKLAWLARNEPDVWSRTRQLLMANSYVVQRLTGEYVLDHLSASQCEPFHDIFARAWIPEWIEQVIPGLPLPRLVWPAETVGMLRAGPAAEAGLPTGIPVAAGTIDAWSEALSVDVRDPGDVMLMYGTTLVVVAVVSDPRPHPSLWLTTGALEDSLTFGAGLATSGALTLWLQEIVQGLPFSELTEEAAAVPPGSNGLVVLPYFAGERSPFSDPRARGLICGLTLDHGRGHLYRALLEGTAFGTRHIVETMDAAGAGIKRLVAVGGGTRGGLWPQIVTDVLGIPQVIPRLTIGASYGDAMLAGMACGLVAPNTRWNAVESVVMPRPEASAAYEPLYRVYRDLYPATAAQMHVLANLQTAAAERA
ncbi:MAG: FGGY-family carbohydrate kinase [Chloroflexota bacterium]